MTVLVFLDPSYEHGRIADAGQPQLMATDLGTTRGDGVFESLLVVHGTPRKLQAHLDRLGASAAAMKLEIPDQQAWRKAIATAVDEFAVTEQADAPEIVLKLMSTRGVEGSGRPTSWVSAFLPSATARKQRETGIDVLLLDRGYDSTLAERAPWLLLGAKTLSYAVNMAAIRYATEQGADDVIFTSSDGKVLEGPTATVLVARSREGVRELLTPRRDSGILPGTTQGALFSAAEQAGWKLGYGPLEPADLFDADGVWLVSSIRLLAPVNSIDGKPVATSASLIAELGTLLEKSG